MGYNLEEYGQDEAETVEERVAQVTASFNEPLDSTEFDDQLEDVEQRLEVATLYRLFLKDRIFSESSVAADTVERRIRNFVKSELKVLLGLQIPADKPTQQQPPQFTEDEVSALRAVAAKISGKPALLTTPKPEAIKKAETTLKRVDIKPTQPVLRQKKNEPEQKVKSQPTQPPQKKRTKTHTFEATNANGEAMKEFVNEHGRLIREYFNKEGVKVLEKDITPQSKAPGAIPMPTGPALEAATMQQAMGHAAHLGNLGTGLANKLMKE